MRTPYYREQALEGIAREVITAYDPNLYYGVPRMIPIEDIIEAQGITLEYQCLRKTGCVLGETIFDDGGAIIYDYDIPGYSGMALGFSAALWVFCVSRARTAALSKSSPSFRAVIGFVLSGVR